MGFKVGDRVIVNHIGRTDWHNRKGTVIALRPSNYYKITVELDGYQTVPFKESELILDNIKSLKYKLTHKTNGSVVTVTKDSPVAANIDEFEALIEGTIEPKVRFIFSEWKVEEIKPPFVFPTKSNAVIAVGESSYIRIRYGNGDVWRSAKSGKTFADEDFMQPSAVRIIFEGTD